MFIRFRQMTAQRYGDGERECAGKCKDRPRHHVRGMFYVKGRTFLEGCPLKPICPLIKPRERLEVSIVETHRDGGKVRQQHVASLGSYFLPGSLRARESFWSNCEARLERLANRIGPDMDRLREDIAARIPPLTDEDSKAIDAAAWQQLEAWWNDLAKRRIERAQDSEKEAVALRRDAAKARAMLLPIIAAQAAGDWETYRQLSLLYGTCVMGTGLRYIKVDPGG
jgi:hypothetical protein